MYDNLKILYIEDSENDTLLMNLALKDLCQNIHSERADNKAELKKMLKKDVWDVIVIDNALPQMTAIEAINLIKSLNIITPLICVSGSDIMSAKEQCLEAGVEVFILKENLKEFVEQIELILLQSFS
ncbi:MAG: response regulator [Candidatus Heimdallarchaeota archaeon]